jgi:6-phosphogluconolactonase
MGTCKKLESLRQEKDSVKRLVYVGQYKGADTCAINVLSVDDTTGEIEYVDSVVGLANTLWLTLSPDASRLYAARDEGISVFDINGAHLHMTAQYEIGHTQPCHMSLSSDGRRLYFAEYSDAVCGSVDIASGKVHSLELSGGGPNLPRQEKAHAHCAVETPDGEHLCVVDLGSDALLLFDPVTLEPHGKVATRPGAGPRHIIFHPSGRFAFLVYELGNIITSFKYSKGSFSPIETLPLLPSDFTGHSQAAAIKISGDGRRMFATNRGHDSVVTFDFDVDAERLTLAATSPLGGSWPRDFTLLPGERIALACLERSGEVRSFSYDRASGGFSPLPYVFRTHRPVVAAI